MQASEPSGRTTDIDEIRMETAISEAVRAAACGEVPVGAALYRGDELLAAAGNMPIATHDPSAHAEILALRQACGRLANYRLPGTTLYVTLEPCVMCAGALLHARVERIVFGAADPKTGALLSRYRVGTDGRLNHGFEIRAGVLAERCGELLRQFFAGRRRQSR